VAEAPEHDAPGDPTALPTVMGKAPGKRATAETADRTLLAEEIARTRIFLALAAAVGGVLVLGVPLLSASVRQRVGLVAVCALVGAVALWLYFKLRDPSSYTEGRIIFFSLVLMIAANCGFLLFGVFSPAPMVVALGIYFLSLGASVRAAVINYVSGALLHAVPAVLISLGVIADPGIFTGATVPASDKLLTALLVQGGYLLFFVMARFSRRATLDAIDQLQTALLQVNKRDALLAEAQGELDRALVGGQLGRFSERQLGRFRLGSIIGRGGMSEVYGATSVDDGRPAAVKVLSESLSTEPRHVRRFKREAEIVRRLQSRHVVRVYDVNTEGSPGYIAMELLEGHDLAWQLRHERRFPPARVLALVTQVADALSEAAAAGIVHRDLKPQNLFAVEEAGAVVWKVLDFGISKLERSGTLTEGNIVGTPGYMAPEQARGGDVGPGADVFTLALIAYRAITGRPAFAGRDMTRFVFDVCYVQPMQPSKLVPLGEDVERVLALGMAKDPNERFAGADELARALARAFSGELDPALRERADALIRRDPWGEPIKRAP